MKTRLIIAAGAALLLAAGITIAVTRPAGAAPCTMSGLNNSCGQYEDNGRAAFIENQDVGAQAGTTGTITTDGFPAAAPPVFTSNVTAIPDNGGVQVFPSVQEQFYDWDGTGWNCNNSSCYNTQVPLSALSALSITYDETSPQDTASQYEFSPDVWSNYPQDLMMWADTSPDRCQSGGFGTQVLGQAVIDGQDWTVTRYGGAGAEMIFVLDGPGGLNADGTPVSCARQTAGTLNIMAAYEWMVAQGLLSNPTIYMVNTGWEVTQADSTDFVLNSYTVNAPIAGGVPVPSPTVTTSAPAPTPTVTTPAPTPTVTTPAPPQDVTFSGCLAAGRITKISVSAAPSCAATATPVQWTGHAGLFLNRGWLG